MYYTILQIFHNFSDCDKFVIIDIFLNNVFHCKRDEIGLKRITMNPLYLMKSYSLNSLFKALGTCIKGPLSPCCILLLVSIYIYINCWTVPTIEAYECVNKLYIIYATTCHPSKDDDFKRKFNSIKVRVELKPLEVVLTCSTIEIFFIIILRPPVLWKSLHRT